MPENPSLRRAALLLLPLLVALLAFVPAIQTQAWLSDDFAYATLLQTRGEAGWSLDWSEVGRQTHERWLFSYAYWRPLVTLLNAGNFLLSGDPRLFGAINLTLHLVVVSATMSLCASLVPKERVRAAVIGGCLVALHPFAVEPVLWISARVSGLEVACGTLGLAAFARHLQAGRTGPPWWSLAFCAAALLAKESAITLPIGLLVVDLLERPRRPLRERLRLHLRFVPLWLGYLALRALLLGSVTGNELSAPGVGAIVSAALVKLGSLFTPDALSTWTWLGAAVVIVIVARRRLGPLVSTCALTGVWLLAIAAPAFTHHIDGDLVGARLLYGALPVLAVLLVRGIANSTLGAIVAVLLVAAHVPATRAATARFEAAFETMRTLRVELDDAGRDADREHPLAILSTPALRGVSGVVHPATYFALGEPPFAARAIPIVSLGGLLEPTPQTKDDDPTTPDLYLDASPLHALLDAGCPVVRWNPGTATLETLRAAGIESGALHPDADGRVNFEAPMSLLALESIVVESSVEATAGEIIWLTEAGEFGDAAALRFDHSIVRDGVREFLVDVTRHPPLMVGVIGGIRLLGVRVLLDRGTARGLFFLDRLAILPDVPRTAGAAVRPDELMARLRLPPIPRAIAREIVMLTPSACYAIPVDPSGALVIPPSVFASLQEHAIHLRGAQVHWFARAPGARSALDAFTLVAN